MIINKLKSSNHEIVENSYNIYISNDIQNLKINIIYGRRTINDRYFEVEYIILY